MSFDMTAAKERLSSALDCAAAEFKPNTVVSVFKDGAPVLRKGYGTAKGIICKKLKEIWEVQIYVKSKK